MKEDCVRNSRSNGSNVKLRRLMLEFKAKSLKKEKSHLQINSPLAKYDNLGRLQCIICRTVIRNENVWRVHISSKAHKLKVESMRQQKDTLNLNASDRFSYNTTKISKAPSLPEFFHISDLRQNPAQPAEIDKCDLYPSNPDESIPEGFFDDPIKDAKARNAEFKDPKDEEWERFQREIKQQSYFSNAIIAGEQDEASVDRQLEEIDEQIEKWSKVINLEKKKEIISRQNQTKRVMKSESMETYSSDECNSIDEFSDWRSKKSFR